jgi:uncharacterized protein YxeA
MNNWKMCGSVIVVLVAICGCALLASTVLAKEKADSDKKDAEKSTPVEKAPQAVQSALDKELRGAKATSLEQEDEDGFVAYEAEYSANNVKHSVKLSEDGTVLETEEEVAVSAIPAAVTAQIQKRFPKATVKEAQRVVSTFFEVTLDANGKEREAKIYANGRPVEEEEDD